MNSRAFFLSKSELIFFAFSLIFAFYQINSPMALLPIAGHDDGLFIRLGKNIYDGNWLGDFNHYTLMKGVALPIVLSALATIKISIAWFYVLLIIFSCNYLRSTFNRITNSNFIGLFASIIIMFYPGFDYSRVLREPLLLWLVVVAIIISINFYSQLADGKFNQAYYFSIAFILGICNITREEGITILAPMLFFIVFSLFIKKIMKSIYLLIFIALFTFVFYLPKAIISYINYSNYGTYIDNDFTEKNYTKSLSLLQSIQGGIKNEHIPVPRDVRLKLYKLSPKFAELYPFLDTENAPLSGWMGPACDRYKTVCGDYGGSWFFWAYRDAVFLAGHYANPRDSINFYKELNKELSELCSNGSLSCTHKLLPIPELTTNQILNLPLDFWTALKIITLQNPQGLHAMPSMGSNDELKNAANFLGLNDYVPPKGSSSYIQNIQLDADYKFKYHKIIIPFKKFIYSFYSVLSPMLLAFGLLATIFLLINRNVSAIYLFMIGSIWIVSFIRIILISVASEVGFADISPAYLGYCGYLIFIASMLSIYFFVYTKYLNGKN
ncbi:hypothetical protein ICN18_04270 [Polynucleobacter sp. Ross1-W9]|uniref:hypothetical protein n=1 Tax=Polynucleobacter parvulilacunae TaxID=1855631 RepID=UPI001C0B00A4|nr:hypothetical protein [Polynucleobacter parvulilacunae]MBU3556839.1 hypothetical protein [Polynucleobacter parvulilacunae]